VTAAPERPPSAARLTAVLAVGVLAIASSAPIIRELSARSGLRGPSGSVAIAAARMTVASLFVLPGLLAARRRGERPPRLGATLFAGVALALHFASWISSLSFTTMAASTVIVTTNPVWVALVTALRTRRAPSRATALGLALSLAGALILAWGDAGSTASAPAPLLGDALALVGAWAATAYYLASKRAQADGASVGVAAGAVYCVAALALAPVALAAGTVGPLFTRAAAPWVLALAALPQLVGHTAFLWAMRHKSPTVITTVILLEPVGASILGLIAFGERPSWTTLAGAAVLLVGVWRTASAEVDTVAS
jgi:drug/metabolite transporter (DMT)-like permease